MGALTYGCRTDCPDTWPRSLLAVRRDVLPADFIDVECPMAWHGSWVVVASIGRQALGYAWGRPFVGEDDACYIEEVAVRRAWHGRGIGTELISRMASWMDADGRHTCGLTPLHDDDEQRRAAWFARLGFHKDVYGMYVAHPKEVVAATATRSR
jgi:GNAT superfamily N-acetyltransferase